MAAVPPINPEMPFDLPVLCINPQRTVFAAIVSDQSPFAPRSPFWLVQLILAESSMRRTGGTVGNVPSLWVAISHWTAGDAGRRPWPRWSCLPPRYWPPAPTPWGPQVAAADAARKS